MDTAVDTASIEEPEVQPVARVAEAKRMFKYSSYLDVGDGAEECEHRRDGKCQDTEHFHAWIRLPNPFQHQDIRNKGLAAKARKLRELKDPESDASVVLDQRLADIDDPAFTKLMTDELLAADWPSDYLDAQSDVEEREEYEHIDQDREEFNRLDKQERDTPAEEQSDEYKRLRDHLEGYVDALRVRLEEVQSPKRAEYESRSPEALVGLVRSRRVEEEADRAFVEIYDPWTWFVGTFKPEPHPTLGRPHLPMWDEIGRKDRPSAGTMFGEAPEVIEALKRGFNELQLALQAGSSGN